MSTISPSSLTIRHATPTDREALDRLAALDSRKRPDGAMLVAATDREIVAAVPLDGGRAIANPFRLTADVVALLEMRAAQLRGHLPPRRHPRGLERSVDSPRPRPRLVLRVLRA